MKKSIIFIICLIFSFVTVGQNKAQSSNQEGSETLPLFAGSEEAANLKIDNSQYLNNYIFENLICPKKAEECCLEGTEIVQFIVTPNGELSNFKVVNSICPEIDEEVIRVLKTTKGMWIPGENNGELASMKKEVTVLFGNCTASNFEKHFVQKAITYYEVGSKNLIVKNKPEKALNAFNQAVRYLPNDKALLLMRGMCYYELGDKENAEKDMNRIVTLGGIDMNTIDYNLAHLKGYSNIRDILAKK